MTLIDRIMRDICEVMEWVDEADPEYLSGEVRAKLTPIAEAADAELAALRAVVEMARGIEQWHDTGKCYLASDPVLKLNAALAALDAAREVTG